MIRTKRSPLASAIACLLATFMTFAPATTLSAELGDPIGGWVDAVPSVRINTLAAAPGASHYLRATSNPELWNLEKQMPGKSSEPAGSFRLQRSMPIDTKITGDTRSLLQEKGILRFDRQIVLGTLHDSEGDERFVSGIRMDIVAVEEDGTTVTESILVPMLDSHDFSKLETLTAAFADALASRSVEPSVPTKNGTNFVQKSVCINYCEMELQDAMTLCRNTALVCVGGATTVGLSCIYGCPLTGALAIPCLIACGVGDAFAVLVCLLNRESCNRSARSQDRACRRACAEEQPF